MPTCIPVKELKNTARFSQIIEESPGPVTVTRNGYDAFVVMRSEDYEHMLYERDRSRLLARIERAELEYECGQFADIDTALAEIEEQYGL